MTIGYREGDKAANERRANWLGWVVGGTVGLNCFAVTTYFEDVFKASMGLTDRGYRVFEWIVVVVVLIAITRLLTRATDRARAD